MLKYLISYSLILLLLNACVTGDNPNSTSSSGFVKTSSESGHQQCPARLSVKLNNKPVEVTTPNPFHGFVNPGFRAENSQLIIELNTKEIGFFELAEFDLSQLQAGTFNGNQFRLTLSYSPYSSDACLHENYKQETQLIIQQYSETDKKIAGCFHGKLDCGGGKLLEINAPVAGKIQ